MEEEEADLPNFELEEASGKNNDDGRNQSGKREICLNGCDRPANVCLCNELPSEPILTSTQILILHHPHELRHRLATVPILCKCLQNCQTLIGRRLRLGSFPLLDSLHNSYINNHCGARRAVFLFPGTDSSPAIELNQWFSSFSSSDEDASSDLVLIVFDGTWKHAKEMVAASLPFLSKFASKVCLDYDVNVEGETIFDSELVLRKEPFRGCMSTIEAVARSLRVLEPNGVEVEQRLISILRAMVRFQTSYLKPLKPRPKLSKKRKEDNKKSSSLQLGS
ncbi:tRNA-uridine aminocarboxypropyltransferase 2 [Macadamia integrifolia]|uniref:tRNA-uridine aminocarboxypropyltransferase 2 n=1 Tax=Macadamia integrifolia TaxID=60698 RepID=UPI001C52F7CD|nr:tRNA-uridine aminocarboxypropyltransferase 2 [Macadamia integrifolia]